MVESGAGARRGVRLDSPTTEMSMRLIGLAVILAISPSLAPLPVRPRKRREYRLSDTSGAARCEAGREPDGRKNREVGEAYGYERPAEDAVCEERRGQHRLPGRGRGAAASRIRARVGVQHRSVLGGAVDRSLP